MATFKTIKRNSRIKKAGQTFCLVAVASIASGPAIVKAQDEPQFHGLPGMQGEERPGTSE